MRRVRNCRDKPIAEPALFVPIRIDFRENAPGKIRHLERAAQDAFEILRRNSESVIFRNMGKWKFRKMKNINIDVNDHPVQ